MKKKVLVSIILSLVTVFLLAGCATGLTASSWPGITTDVDAAYIAGGPYVYSVNLATGAELWRFPEKASTANPFYAAPVLSEDGQLIFGGFDHKLYSLNPQTKAQNWVFTGAHDRYIGSVLISGNVVYAPNSDYYLYAISLKTGTKLWDFKADQSLWSAPVTDGSRVFFSTLGGKVYALDAATGALAWEASVKEAVLGSPVVKDNVLYLTTYGGTLQALNSASGELLWSKPVAGRVWSGPVLNGDTLYFGDASGGFYAFDLQGNVTWQQPLNGAVVGSPIFASDGTIVAATDLGNVYFMDPDGKNLTPVSLSGKIYSSPAASGSLFLVAPTGGDNLLVALDKSGTQKWAFTPAK